MRIGSETDKKQQREQERKRYFSLVYNKFFSVAHSTRKRTTKSQVFMKNIIVCH